MSYQDQGRVIHRGFQKKILIAPIDNVRDIFNSIQLRDRNFWVKVDHSELGCSIPYCGPFAKINDVPLQINRSAPLIGEYNGEIYGQLGILNEDLALLFTWNAAVSMAIKFLADSGATVIHVETHTRLDLLRMISPFKDNKPGVNRIGFFSRYESSKLGITLNLNNPGSREVALRLVKWADIKVILGYTDEEFASFLDQGVITTEKDLTGYQSAL